LEIQNLTKSGKTLSEILKILRIDEPNAGEKFKIHYASDGLQLTKFAHGADVFLNEITGIGLQPVVISAKTQSNLDKSMKFLGLEHIPAFGELHGSMKTSKLLECTAVLYAGDQISDVVAANKANIISVLIGSSTTSELLEELPDFVFTNMLEFSKHISTILKS